MYRAAFLGTVLLCLTPALVLVASALHPPVLHASLPPVVDHALTVLASIAMLAALGTCLINRRLMSLNASAQEGLAAKHVSPIPFVGSFFVVLGGVLGYGSTWLAILGLALLALDPGGGPSALLPIVRNRKVLFGRR
jgi:hypothetical protein